MRTAPARAHVVPAEVAKGTRRAGAGDVGPSSARALPFLAKTISTLDPVIPFFFARCCNSSASGCAGAASPRPLCFKMAVAGPAPSPSRGPGPGRRRPRRWDGGCGPGAPRGAEVRGPGPGWGAPSAACRSPSPGRPVACANFAGCAVPRGARSPAVGRLRPSLGRARVPAAGGARRVHADAAWASRAERPLPPPAGPSAHLAARRWRRCWRGVPAASARRPAVSGEASGRCAAPLGAETWRGPRVPCAARGALSPRASLPAFLATCA